MIRKLYAQINEVHQIPSGYVVEVRVYFKSENICASTVRLMKYNVGNLRESLLKKVMKDSIKDYRKMKAEDTKRVEAQSQFFEDRARIRKMVVSE